MHARTKALLNGEDGLLNLANNVTVGKCDVHGNRAHLLANAFKVIVCMEVVVHGETTGRQRLMTTESSARMVLWLRLAIGLTVLKPIPREIVCRKPMRWTKKKSTHSETLQWCVEMGASNVGARGAAVVLCILPLRAATSGPYLWDALLASWGVTGQFFRIKFVVRIK
jgi:hypothetical protein